jgi:nucleotide-binding universal stress UspA family protein
MFKLKRILFPVDFSERATKAAPYVDALATQFGAELILLHVVEPLSYNAPLADSPGSQWERFGDIFSAHHLQIKRLTEHGEAAAKIVECAKTHNVDLIMIPTQGLGAFRRLIIGSNSAKVLHDADCPVWTGVHIEEGPHPKKVTCRNVLCAFDLEPSSAKVLRWASGLAEGYKAELTLVHVTTDSTRARKAIETLQKTVGTNAPVRIEAGEPSRVVAHVAGEMKADILVIGRCSTEGILGRLEMTAYSIIRQSPCPVISV